MSISKLRPRMTWQTLAIVFLYSLMGNLSLAEEPVTAIDILLKPDAEMMSRARTVNARLRENYPDGFALDATHMPHVTLVQAFVRTSDLARVNRAVAEVAAIENPTEWNLQATGYYDIPVYELGLAGIVIKPTPELIRLQKKLLEQIAPYTAKTATGAAFMPREDGRAILEPTIDYVATFAETQTGKQYNPHVTVGLGKRAFLDELKSKPFESFSFGSEAVEIFQLGEYGTAQKQLWSSADPLPSWQETESKKAITSFVKAVTDKNSPDFVPEAERIAVFDNDGTLWSEQPVYFQLRFAIDRVKTLAEKHPEWKNEQPFKAVLESDTPALIASGKEGLVKLMMATHTGMTTEEFAKTARNWLNTAKHPRFGRIYKELVFQPMLELLEYLRANGFKTYIVSGGGVEFLRVFAEEVYGVPPEQVIGSSIKTKFEIRDGKPVLVRLPEIDFINDKEGKPVAINQFIARRPILAAGNSDGDLQMLQWTTSGSGARFGLIVHHTDAKREWAYDRKSHIGGLDKAWDEAKSKGWTVVDMKNDWKTIYPQEKP